MTHEEGQQVNISLYFFLKSKYYNTSYTVQESLETLRSLDLNNDIDTFIRDIFAIWFFSTQDEVIWDYCLSTLTNYGIPTNHYIYAGLFFEILNFFRPNVVDEIPSRQIGKDLFFSMGTRVPYIVSETRGGDIVTTMDALYRYFNNEAHSSWLMSNYSHKPALYEIYNSILKGNPKNLLRGFVENDSYFIFKCKEDRLSIYYKSYINPYDFEITLKNLVYTNHLIRSSFLEVRDTLLKR